MKIKITKELDKQLHDLARYYVKNNPCKPCTKEYYCIKDVSPCEEYDKFIENFEEMKRPVIQGSTELEKYLYILIEFIDTSSKIYDLEKKLTDIQKRKDLIENTFEYCD